MLLCRKIENEIGGINFITVNNRVLLFRKSLSTSVTVKRLYEEKEKKKIELEKVQKMTFDKKSILTAASTIRAQIRNMDCKMQWPAQADDLKTDDLILCSLGKFHYNRTNV